MNIFENTKTKKVFSAFVGVAVSLTMVLPASAATNEELQAQITALLAQIASLQTQISGSTSTTVSAYTFTKDLKLGSSGADVKALQKVLNANPATVVSTTGVGSAGQESEYFGAKTKAAVIKFQTANGIAPAAGYVGPLTRAKLNSMSTGTTPPVATGPVTVTLAASSPTSDGGLLQGQATAHFADFQFTGAGTVTSVTLKRSGFSDQDALTAVYLYDGVNRLTDGYTFNTAGNLVMNNLNIVVNGSKVISVKADVQDNDTLFANQSSVAIGLTSFTAGGTANAVNVQGNALSMVAGTLATVTLANTNAATGTPTVNAGTANYTVWGNTLQVTQRSVLMKGATFKVVGSAPANSLSNISLIVDGVKVGNSALIDSLGNVTFDVSASPVTLATGSHTIDVRADIVNGSSRNFYFTLEKAGDIMLTDSVYGVNTAIGGSPTTFVPARYKAGTITIGEGTLALTKDTSFDTSINLTSGASNVAIGKYKLQAYSEDVKVKQVTVTLTEDADTGLQNVGLYLNGAQVGSTQNLAASVASLTFNLGSALIVPAGTTALFEVRADMSTAASAAFTGGIVTDVAVADAQGMSSQTTVTAGSPGTTNVTVAAASATLAANVGYTNQAVGGNSTGVKIGSYVIKAGATEGVRVTNLNVAFVDASTSTASSTAYSVEATDMANLTISLDGGLTKMAPVSPSLTANNFSVDFTVASGQTKTIDVYADVTAASNGETIKTSILATARGASSNIAITTGVGFASVRNGQTMTVGSGSLATLTVTTSSDTSARYVVGGTTGQNMIRYNLTATGGALTVQELTFDLTGTVDGAITSLSVSGNQGGTTCTAPVIGTEVAFTGCNIPVPQGFGGTDVIVTANLGTVGYNGIASNATATVDLLSVKHTNGVSSATINLDGTAAPDLADVATSSVMRAVASIPTFTLTASSNTLTNGEVKLGTLTVSANSGGSINLNTIPVTIVVSGGAWVASTSPADTIVVKEGGTTLATTDTITAATSTSLAKVFSFDNNTIVTAGASRTFDIYVNFANVTGGDDSASLSISPASSLDWDDVAGNGTGLSGTLLNGYPTNSVTIND